MSHDLKKIATVPKDSLSKADIKKETEELLNKIYEYQRIMYAQQKYSVLLVLQGMDAAGKDGSIKDLFSGMNPLGCKISAFKGPTSEELSHDFLWRIHKETPEKGMIQIFNRSHYEDILVPTVKKLASEKEIAKRYDHINNFEELLTDSNTRIVKCYLHISREKQKEKLEERLNLPHKFWKHNDNDRESRELWDEYMKAYKDIFKKCDKPEWNIIPADKNRYKVYTIAKLLVKEFESMELEWPDLETEKFA